MSVVHTCSGNDLVQMIGKPISLEDHQAFIAGHPALQAIGDTPLVALDLPFQIGKAEISAKYEHLNPGGSIKDRPVLRMLVSAILDGTLIEGKTIIDATSGNAGISYAMIGAILGYEVEVVMPANASEERKKRIKAHGANITLTDPMLGYDESLVEVRRKYELSPEKYFWCDQYGNYNNPLAHYETTAEEILRQQPDLTHFVAGVGTGGTISGVGKKLKEVNSDVSIVCILPADWRGIEGLKPLGENNIYPEVFDEDVVDEKLDVDVDQSYTMAKLLSSKGIFVGQSSGAYLLGAKIVAERHQKGKIVTIFNDIGERYFSTHMWD